MIHFDPEVGHLNLAIVALLNIVGYVIYRYEILTLFCFSKTCLNKHFFNLGLLKPSAVNWPGTQSLKWTEYRQKMALAVEN